MSENQFEEAVDILKMALEYAEYEMLRDKAMKKEFIIQSDGNGGCRKVPATAVFEELFNEPAPSY